MRTLALAFSLALPCSVQVSVQAPQIAGAGKTLQKAILLAGPDLAGLPIVLAAVPPDEASRGIEGWLLSSRDGMADRIAVYTGSDVFRCASHRDRQDYQCLLKLASILVHEAWHYRHGREESGAYDVQIAFLTNHGGSSARITGVRIARARVLAAQQAIERRRK